MGTEEPEYSVVRKAAYHGGSPTRPGLAVQLPIDWVFLHGLKARDPLIVEVRRGSLTILPTKETRP